MVGTNLVQKNEKKQLLHLHSEMQKEIFVHFSSLIDVFKWQDWLKIGCTFS